MFFLYQYRPQATHFNMPLELVLNGALDTEAFMQALRHTLDGHAIYRTTYALRDGIAYQRYQPELAVPIGFLDLSADGAEDRDALLAQRRKEIAGQAFILEQDAPLRACLIQTAPDAHTLLLAFHHIATDEWSVKLLLNELAERYRALRMGREVAQTSIHPATYRDFAQWQKGHVERGGYSIGRSFWQHELDGCKGVLELPTDYKRPALPTYRGGRIRQRLSNELLLRRNQFIKDRKLSEFAFHLALYYLLLNQLTGESDIVVGTDTFGRDHAELERVAGFFVNQLALRGRVHLDESFEACADRTYATTLRALAYQETPFDKVVEDFAQERDEAYTPLFQVKFLYHSEGIEYDIFEGVSAHSEDAFEVTSQYDLTMQIVGDQVTCFYNSDLFESANVQSWMMHYFGLMRMVLEAPASPLAQLLQEDRMARLAPWIHGLSKPAGLFNGPYQRFRQSALKHPDELAVCAADEQATYAMLLRQVEQVGQQLAMLGIGAGSRVAVYLERSVNLVVAILSIMRAGAVFVPVDPDYPVEQADFMLDNSEAPVVISDRAHGDALSNYAGMVLDIDVVHRQGAQVQAHEFVEPEPEVPAYLLYTSGSTGYPKGVLIDHAGLSNLCDWYVDFAGIDHNSRVLLMIPVSFDASIKNILAPLMVGARLVLAPSGLFDAAALVDLIQAWQVSVINCVPSAFYALLKSSAADDFSKLNSLNMVALGGESLNLSLLQVWLQRPANRAWLANIYGPTECADISLAHVAPGEQWLQRSNVTVGRPIQNCQAYIVDEHLRLCMPGAVGELLIGGSCVGLGYHQLPAATLEAYLDLGGALGRVYRTGDFCKYDTEGNIIYVGRRDGQLKIRGKRVESAQVVHAIQQQLAGAHVSIQLYTGEGLEVLLAFIEGAQQDVDESHLLDALSAQLPRHMVPRRAFWVDRFPLTPNGKVSRAELLKVFEAHKAELSTQTEPLTATEEAIAGVWRDLLGVKEIGRQADFFALGGDSILSIQVVAELAQKGMALSVADVFRHSKLEQLAAFCSRSRRDPVVQAVSRAPFSLIDAADTGKLPPDLEDAYPATLLQLGMLFHGNYAEAQGVYHDVFSFNLSFRYEEETFRRAMDRVVALNQALRTRFDTRSFSVPMQLVQKQMPAAVSTFDLSSLEEGGQNEAIRRYVEELKHTPLAPESPSLIRFSVFKRREGRIQLVIDAHHAILDGWSMATLQRQLFEIYWELCQAGEATAVFDSHGLRFADYVAEQLAEQQNEQSKGYWTQYCRERPYEDPLRSWPLGRFTRCSLPLEQSMVEKLRAAASVMAVSPKVLFFVAHTYMLRTLATSRRVMSAITDNGRPEALGAQNLVGLFLNTLPAGLDFTGRTWRQLIEETHAAEIERKPYRAYPYSLIIKQHQGAAATSLFTYTNFHVVQGLLQGDRLAARLDDVHEETDFQLSTLISSDGGDGMIVHLGTRLDRSEARIMELAQRMVSALRAMLADVDAMVPDLGLAWLPRWRHPALPGVGVNTYACIRHKHLHHDHAAALRSWLDHVAARIADKPIAVKLLDAGVQVHVDIHAGIEQMAAALHGAHDLAGVQFEMDSWQYFLLRIPAAQLSTTDWAMFGGGLLEAYRFADQDPPEVLIVGTDHWQWHVAGALDRSIQLWREQLQDAPTQLRLPVDWSRRACDGGGMQTHRFSVSKELMQALQAKSASLDASLTDALLMAWAVLLGRLSGQEDVVIGVPACMGYRQGGAGADDHTILPIRVAWDSTSTQHALVGLVQQRLRAAVRHAQLTLEQIVDVAGWRTHEACAFQATFESGSEKFSAAAMASELSLNVAELPEGLVCTLGYAADRFDEATIVRWAACWRQWLSAYASTQLGATQLPLLGEDESRALFAQTLAAMASYPSERTIHELFEAQVERTPEAVALVFEGRTLSYGELNGRANRLAHALIGM
ncbi:MAG TPA: amino acid adenylation domain-containing protein, partial [Dyella sp.]